MTGNGEWGMGNGKWEMENGKWGTETGNRKSLRFLLMPN